MFQKMMYFSDAFRDHIESFRRHYGIKTTAEAIRTLVLAGFTYYGNPLEENPYYHKGKPKLDNVEAINAASAMFINPPVVPLEERVSVYDPEEVKALWARVNGRETIQE